ncbi:hypothetical protein NLI96_g11404 [Meripilus lineatus]|uniref:Uncharacterized protein n=1 Tax=Meripilus lineatus TaxID=2056292 RepID=A0AAD5UTD8_9APHY|nr:hypothetical protein NLI96_g11404 [Physisporinus lineatus]
MPAQRWTSPDQLAFLEEKIPAFLERQQDRTLKNERFFKEVVAQFFLRWPEQLVLWPPVGRPPDALDGFEDEVRAQLLASHIVIDTVSHAAQPIYPYNELSRESKIQLASRCRARKKQIESWFRYHSNKKIGVKAAIRLKHEIRPKKKLSNSQAFSKLYKDEKGLRAQFEEEYPQFKCQMHNPDDRDPSVEDSDDETLPADDEGDEKEKRKSTEVAEAKARRKEYLKYWNLFVSRCYEGATLEEKNEVEVYQEKAKEESEAAKSNEGSGDNVASPAECDRAIQGIHHTIEPVINKIASATGLNVFLCLGGPMPDQGGRMGFIHFFSGRKTPEGATVQAFDSSFEQKAADIYLPYLSAVWPPGERRARALPSSHRKSTKKLASKSSKKGSEKSRGPVTPEIVIDHSSDEATDTMHATSGDEIYSSEGEEGGDKEKAVLETEFDTARRLNIERNNQMLKSLGLDQSPLSPVTPPHSRKPSSSRSSKSKGKGRAVEMSKRHSTRLTSNATNPTQAEASGSMNADDAQSVLRQPEDCATPDTVKANADAMGGETAATSPPSTMAVSCGPQAELITHSEGSTATEHTAVPPPIHPPVTQTQTQTQTQQGHGDPPSTDTVAPSTNKATNFDVPSAHAATSHNAEKAPSTVPPILSENALETSSIDTPSINDMSEPGNAPVFVAVSDLPRAVPAAVTVSGKGPIPPNPIIPVSTAKSSAIPPATTATGSDSVSVTPASKLATPGVQDSNSTIPPTTSPDPATLSAPEGSVAMTPRRTAFHSPDATIQGTPPLAAANPPSGSTDSTAQQVAPPARPLFETKLDSTISALVGLRSTTLPTGPPSALAKPIESTTSSSTTVLGGSDTISVQTILDSIDGVPHLPNWIQNALTFFVTQDFGATWVAALRAWVRYEWMGVEVHDWMKRGRKFTAINPWTEEVFDAFKTSFIGWYKSLQPNDRSLFSTDKITCGDWSDMQRYGPNGIMLVLLCLFWWGSNSVDTVWTQYIQDFTFCLNSMTTSDTTGIESSTSLKRTAENDGTGNAEDPPSKRIHS